MTTLSVKTADDFLPAIRAAAANDVVKVAAGLEIPEVALPNVSVDPKTPITVTSASETDLAVFRGLLLDRSGTGNFAQLGEAGGSTFRGLVLDTVAVKARASNKFKLPSGDTVTLKKAVGWRADASYKGAGSGEHAAMMGVKLGKGAKDLVFRNVFVEGFAKGFNLSGPRGVRFEHIELSRNCEDGFIVWGGSDLSWRYCSMSDFDGLDYEDAVKLGWKPNAEKVGPHSDNYQCAGSASGLSFYGCTLKDDTCRVHGWLFNDPSKSGKRIYSDVSIENCALEMTHTTAFFGGNCDGFTFRNNKVVRTKVFASGEVPKGKNDTKLEFVNLGGKVEITDNQCRKVYPSAKNRPADWTWRNNVETNDAGILPAGFIEIRHDKVQKGQEAAGMLPKGERRPSDPRPTPEPAPEPELLVKRITGIKARSAVIESDGSVTIRYVGN